jgi:hypothetical protein
MQSTESNRCKTDNKYREYGACEIAGVYSRTMPYVGSVTDGETGILAADDPGEWLAALKILVSDPDWRIQIGKNANRDVHRRYSTQTVAEAWVPHIREIAARGPFPPLRVSRMRTLPVPKALDRMRTLAIQVGAVYQAGGVNEVVRSARRRLRDGP